jgi:hypothetical protein
MLSLAVENTEQLQQDKVDQASDTPDILDRPNDPIFMYVQEIRPACGRNCASSNWQVATCKCWVYVIRVCRLDPRPGYVSSSARTTSTVCFLVYLDDFSHVTFGRFAVTDTNPRLLAVTS